MLRISVPYYIYIYIIALQSITKAKITDKKVAGHLSLRIDGLAIASQTLIQPMLNP